MIPEDFIEVHCRYDNQKPQRKWYGLEVYSINGEIKVRPCYGSDSRICLKCAADAREKYLATQAQLSLFE